ncbi:MAG: hypothetical protein UW42_C0019G0009 [Candidatus Collierbacteria bacterium GW2011_GWB1_44_197]|nr:MAG: hypothetical protein UW42_C0019G0009 [Candidatus Collierbacteria bacterium GW2011_GWB1_44_197]
MGSIKRSLGVSKSSVSLWCSDIELTKEQQEKLIEIDRKGGAKGRMVAARNKINERLERQNKYVKEGRNRVGDISKRELLLVGAALYWAEGNKKGRRLTFTNSDPEMIKICIKWLKECLNIPREDIYCYVGINQLHSERVKTVEKYWSDISEIPLEHFRKVSLKKVRALKFYENPDEHFGTLNVRIKKSANLSYLVLGLIAGLGNHEAN